MTDIASNNLNLELGREKGMALRDDTLSFEDLMKTLYYPASQSSP